LMSELGKRSRQIGQDKFDMKTNANRIADLLVGLARS